MVAESIKYHFTYKGTTYDATDYAQKHPGGLIFLQNMTKITNDFTEYFRALHSDQAEKILKSMPVLSTSSSTPQSQSYLELYRQVEPYFAPNLLAEAALLALILTTFLNGLLSSNLIVAALGFCLTQIVVGWIGHSCAHSRIPFLMKYGQIVSSLIGGLSLEWWSPKHNMHHMFTNIQKYDEDIQHKYCVYLFPFLYLKWRYDSLISAITHRNYTDIVLIAVNYGVIFYFWNSLPAFIVGELVAGFYSAFVLIGNHEREKRFEQKPDMPFVQHQIITCRNYREESLLWLVLMGGMQFQTEHHLFPQVPFYRLPTVKPIIAKYLGARQKSIIYGTVI